MQSVVSTVCVILLNNNLNINFENMAEKLLALFVVLVTVQGFVRGQEPKCFSTFDYQEKLLEKMVSLTHSVHTMEKQLEKKFEELGKASDKFTEDHRALDAKFAELEGSLKDETKHSLGKMKEKQDSALTDNSKKIDEMLKVTDAKVVRMSEDFRQMNFSLAQMVKDSIRPNVAFLAKDVSNLSPGANTQFVYTTALLNTDNSYSTSTGVFIAPVGGTYWFSTQICFQHRKSVKIGIYVNDIRMNSARYYDSDAVTCSSSNTVALLTKGDRVYVKNGPNTSSGNVIYQDTWYWNTFMGSLVN